MKVALYLALFVCLAIATVPQEEGVYVLDTSNFDEWLSGQEFALIEFYAPWCGHCKNLAPHYAEAAQSLVDSPASLAKVDCTQNEGLAQRFEVRGFPTLFWFSKDNQMKPTPYSGPREANGIINWITKQTSTKIQEGVQSDITSTLESFPVVVLYGEISVYQDLLSLSRNVNDIQFLHVSDSAAFGNYKNGDIVVYPQHKDAVVLSNDQEISDQIFEHAFPPVVEFSQDNFARLATKDFVLIAVQDFSSEEKMESLKSILASLAENKNVGVMYGDSTFLMRAIQGAGASGNFLPTIVAVATKTNAQIVYDEDLEFNLENTQKWVAGLFDGSTTTFKKSEALPEDDGSAVQTLVYKNFASFVGNGVPAFVKFYAPWCGHCKSLAPVWEELGESFKDANVVIGKLDATANYVDAQISGYPTLMWYDGEGNATPFQGGRTLEELSAFVNQQLPAGHSHDEL